MPRLSIAVGALLALVVVNSCKDAEQMRRDAAQDACFARYTYLESKVFQTLDSDTGCAITGCGHAVFSCDHQKAILDVLSGYPPDRRAEAFARILDAARGAQ
jgi:hypothetical protein